LVYCSQCREEGNVKVIVVIGDIVASSRYDDRAALQERLSEALARVNRASTPASIFTITAGDEVEAVYSRGDTVVRDILSIIGSIHPVRMRFSIAIGSITTKLDPLNPLTADGPAFHEARRVIMELKANKEMLRISSEPGVDVAFENNAARLLALHVADWRPKRWEVYRQLSAGELISDIWREVGISSVAVYKNRRAGAMDLIIDLADDIGKALTRKLIGGP
jgi:hypothetical protein